MSSGDRISRIRTALLTAFPHAEIEISDDSHLHAGHAGASTGLGHFSVRILSVAFTGLIPVARHRLVYAAMGELMQTDVHALAIKADTPA